MHTGKRPAAWYLFIFLAVIEGRPEWEKINSSLNLIAGQNYYCFITFVSSEIILVQGVEDLYRSENGGEDWEFIPIEGYYSAEFSVQSITFADENHGWILHEDTLYATTDGGNDWKALPLSTGGFRRICFKSALHGVACTESGFYHTEDGGETWKNAVINATLDGSIVINNLHFSDQTTGYASSWGPGMDIGTVFISNDGGKSWDVLRSAYEYNSVWSIDSLHIVAGGINSMHRCGFIEVTFDGGKTWKDTLVESFVDYVAFADSGNGVAAAGTGMILETHDGGKSWEKSEFFSNTLSKSAAVSENTIYVLSANGDIYRYKTGSTARAPFRVPEKTVSRRNCQPFTVTGHEGCIPVTSGWINLAGRKPRVHPTACGFFLMSGAVDRYK